jgi:hypothetical protein
MIINKFIILLCLIFIILLLVKISRENFQPTIAQQSYTTTLNYNCNNYNTKEICDPFEKAEVCKWHGDVNKCKPICRFSADTLVNKTEIDTQITAITKFDKCKKLCEAETGANNSYCNANDCLDKCNQQDYGGRKGLIKYEPRPTDITVDKHYDNVVQKLLDLDPTHQVYQQIIDPLKEYTLSKIGNNRAEELEDKVNQLNNITGILDGLQDTSFNIDNKGSYKFVENLERLINKKRSLNDNIEYQVKAKMIQDKIGQIKTLAGNLRRNTVANTGVDTDGVFKSVRCLGNGLTLHIEAIIYGTADQYIQRDKEYLIRVNENILFYEKRNKSDNKTTCDTDSDCDFTLTNGTFNDVYNGFNADVSEDQSIRKQGAYFYIIRMDNSRDYNTVIKNSGKLNFDNNDLKYPFYIIQPSDTDGNPTPNKCINLDKKGGVIKLTIQPCSNTPTERFEANPYTVFDESCT